jgi:hypothetical protein
MKVGGSGRVMNMEAIEHARIKSPEHLHGGVVDGDEFDPESKEINIRPSEILGWHCADHEVRSLSWEGTQLAGCHSGDTAGWNGDRRQGKSRARARRPLSGRGSG